MLICGLKLTHDGSIAVLDGSRLLFSIEIEKLSNNRRHQPVDNLELIDDVLAFEGLVPDDIDVFVVDGWHAEPGERTATLNLAWHGEPVKLGTAPYHEQAATADSMERHVFSGLPLASGDRQYYSFHHATDHILGAYCASPFAKDDAPAYVLVWDGGMLPMLYRVTPNPVAISNYGPLFPLFGNVFAEFAGCLDPFVQEFNAEFSTFGRRRPSDIAGKAMAYAALGDDNPESYPVFDSLLDQIGTVSIDIALRLAEEIAQNRGRLLPGYSNADLIASFQGYIGHVLLNAFRRHPATSSDGGRANLCLSGGCALNIKWNSKLRESGLFSEVWVPPFTNDSGSALGAACSQLATEHGVPAIEWSVFGGPLLDASKPPAEWRRQRCDARHVAKILDEEGEPVVVMQGRAELGPRALGNRSILAPACEATMKDHLNNIKDRENYRPVAPICIEDSAPSIFRPGSPDPYMLFEHQVRANWRSRIPAVVHLDGTARLQTVNTQQNPLIAQVLIAYEERTGIPVLCNTSANYKSRGFFPDVLSAAKWGRAKYIWSDSQLYVAPEGDCPSRLRKGYGSEE